jgi:hypothetical protein
MRISADRNDPGYAPHLITRSVRVEFDGIVQGLASTGRAIVTADEEAGTIVYYSRDPNSSQMRLMADGEGLVKRVAAGKVRVILPAKAAPCALV